MPLTPDDVELARLAQRAVLARERSDTAEAALTAALAACRAAGRSWTELEAVTGITVAKLRWRLSEREESTQAPVARRRDDPADGLSLQVAASELGLSRQGLRNQLAAAAARPGERVTVEDVAGHTVHVLAGAGPRAPWRIWIEGAR